MSRTKVTLYVLVKIFKLTTLKLIFLKIFAYHKQNTPYKLYDKTDFTRQFRVVILSRKPKNQAGQRSTVWSDVAANEFQDD